MASGGWCECKSPTDEKRATFCDRCGLAIRGKYGAQPARGNRRYVNGAAFERRVKAKLEKDGWTVWRTPGSKSPADLVCIRGSILGPKLVNAEVRFVQAKGGKSTITRAKRAQFKAFAENLGGEAYIATRGLKLERA